MSNTTPDTDICRTSSTPLGNSASADSDRMWMTLPRAQQFDSSCFRMHRLSDGQHVVMMCSDDKPHGTTVSWDLYAMISRMQCIALEHSLIEGLVTAEYLIDKLSKPSNVNGYLRVQLPVRIRACTWLEGTIGPIEKRYRVELEKSMLPRIQCATLSIYSDEKDALDTETVPAEISKHRQEQSINFLSRYAEDPDSVVIELLRQIDTATAAIAACAK